MCKSSARRVVCNRKKINLQQDKAARLLEKKAQPRNGTTQRSNQHHARQPSLNENIVMVLATFLIHFLKQMFLDQLKARTVLWYYRLCGNIFFVYLNNYGVKGTVSRDNVGNRHTFFVKL